jgi:hypothetical protein
MLTHDDAESQGVVGQRCKTAIGTCSPHLLLFLYELRVLSSAMTAGACDLRHTDTHSADSQEDVVTVHSAPAHIDAIGALAG